MRVCACLRVCDNLYASCDIRFSKICCLYYDIFSEKKKHKKTRPNCFHLLSILLVDHSLKVRYSYRFTNNPRLTSESVLILENKSEACFHKANNSCIFKRVGRH